MQVFSTVLGTAEAMALTALLTCLLARLVAGGGICFFLV